MVVAAEQFIATQQAESYRFIEPVHDIGERALWGAGVFVRELGVNDPLTHLEQYLENGEAAMNSIDEDLITDCAERIEKPRFINPVQFDRVVNDFISRQNKFSMRSMTAKTEYKFAGNATDIRLYKRAKIESKEVDRLSNWFEGAEANEAYIVESMPITENETYTIVRIYQKVNAHVLIEHVVTLHNSSVGIFNELRRQLSANVPESQTPLELLNKMYAYHLPESCSFSDFLDQYVATYDGILAARNLGKEFSFGLERSERPDPGDDVAMVRRQAALRSVYLDNIRALGTSGGYVTPQVLNINKNLNLGLSLEEGLVISAPLARSLLDFSLQHIAATLNRAPAVILDRLASTGDKASAIESAGYYGSEARANGVRYEGACPSGPGGIAAQEAAALAHGQRINQDPTKCVTCPACRKTVDLPKDLFKKKIYHCVECKTTYKNGEKIDHRTLESYGVKKKNFSAMDILGDWWRRQKQEDEIKTAAGKQAKAELGRDVTYLDKKRYEKQIRQKLAA
ncbi:hypothetical protein HYW36_02465 [Candidatus Saccharibacteria bacterium]|nr:hypothetical protein [Candidatus Saccharibacteria bacterium]